jgi:hypothetical protein
LSFGQKLEVVMARTASWELVRDALADGSFVRIRREAGLTQQRCAELADMGGPDLCRFEHVHRVPGRSSCLRLYWVLRWMQAKVEREQAS